MFGQIFHLVVFLPFVALFCLAIFTKYWWIFLIIGVLFLGLYLYQRSSNKKIEERIGVLKEKIALLHHTPTREYVVLKDISSQGVNDENQTLLYLLEEANKLNADAIINLVVNNQYITSTESKDDVWHLIGTGKDRQTIQSSVAKDTSMVGTAIKYKYTEEEETLMFTENDAVEAFKNLDILKTNEIINEEEYQLRKQNIKDKLTKYNEYIKNK